MSDVLDQGLCERGHPPAPDETLALAEMQAAVVKLRRIRVAWLDDTHDGVAVLRDVHD